MSSIVRLSSGDVIQIREGVLQGLGPQGPTGPSGPQGQQGLSGPQGVPGPMGQIDDFFTAAHNLGAPQSVASRSESLMSFPQVVADEPSLVTSVTNLSLPVGLWHARASLIFFKPSTANASGWRKISFHYNGVEYDVGTQNAIPDIDTTFGLHTFIEVTASGRLLQVYATHSDVVSLAVGIKLFCSRLGPGAQGDAGDQGDVGAPGPVGPTGPQGPSGALINNTTTYAAIGG